MGAVAERDHRSERRLLQRLRKQVRRVGGREWDDLLEVLEERRADAVAAQPPARRTLRAVPAPPPAAASALASALEAHPALAPPPSGPLPAPAVPNLTALAPPAPPPPSSGQGK